MAIYDIYGNQISGSLSSPMELPFENKIAVFLGDSICCFDKNTGGTGAIPDYMASQVGGTWHNFCVGGTTMASYRTSNSTYDMFTLGELADSIASGNFANQQTGVTNGVGAGSTSYSAQQKVNDMKNLDWSTVNTIFIHFGTNDIAYKNSVGTANDTASKNGTMVASLKYAVNTILAKYPQMRIVICGVIYRYADACMPTDLIPVNTVLKETCASIGIPFVDLFEEMGVNTTNRTTFLYDGTHPNANGKERYVECLRKHIY